MDGSGELGTVPDVRRTPGSATRAGTAADEPAGSARFERMAPEALVDYDEWRGADRDIDQDGIAPARRAGPVAAQGAAGERGRDVRGPQDEIEAWHASGGVPEGFDPREGLRRIRAPFPLAAAAGESIVEGRTMPPTGEASGISPGGRDRDAGIGGGATGAIERLLREQNEMIRQDAQRSASPPIAAPPPLRGGGMRM